MRRLLALLLVLVVPIKSIGAAVLPIVGAPLHQHPAPATATTHDAASAGVHAACDFMMGADDGAPGSGDGAPHEHKCPHMGMATLLPVVPGVTPERSTPRVDASPARPFASVVLDILVPPPL